VYGASMFFVAAIMWLVLRWMDGADKEGNEKYVLMIAYLIGLSLGVHLLALLAIFPVLMVIYFRKYEVTTKSAMRFGVIAVLTFWVAYPGIVKYLPGMMDGEFAGAKSDVIAMIPWVIIAAVCYGVYTSYRKKQKMLHIALLSIVLIFLGYTTYTSVLIRANTDVPMNENDPSNLARLTSYLGREQYGSAPLFMPRRYSQEAHQQGIYTNYSSDMDFLLRYQLNHMFFRYLGWNYIGQAGDTQDSGVSWKETWGIPLFLALWGLYYQLKRDWKMGLVFVVMFVIMGPALALYQNQQEPQPRERDYFYVGAFFVMSLWIGVGVVGIIDAVKRLFQQHSTAAIASACLVSAALVVVPVNLMKINWREHDRSGNYVAWDYSYNILQTCEKDAILFTNGDNDTFPLWYLQDVEGVRRDVRIVNLSLVNTSWYILQMKKKPYYKDAQAVPISFTNSEIERIAPIRWEPRTMRISVPQEVLARYGVTDTAEINRGAIEFMLRNTREIGGTKALLVQDLMVHNIIASNQWKRPIFFAVTVAPDSKIGLDDYLWFEGLAWKLEPRKVSPDDYGLEASVLEKNLYDEPEGFSTTPRYGYKFRNVADPNVYFDENISRLMRNYRVAFRGLAMYYSNIHQRDKSVATLERMDTLMPRSKLPMEWDLSLNFANFYKELGRPDKFNEILNEIEPVCQEEIKSGEVNLSSYDNPYRILLEVYQLRNDYPKMLDLLKDLSSKHPELAGEVSGRIASLEAQLKTQHDTTVAKHQ
jgi:hypothetical protein